MVKNLFLLIVITSGLYGMEAEIDNHNFLLNTWCDRTRELYDFNLQQKRIKLPQKTTDWLIQHAHRKISAKRQRVIFPKDDDLRVVEIPSTKGNRFMVHTLYNDWYLFAQKEKQAIFSEKLLRELDKERKTKDVFQFVELLEKSMCVAISKKFFWILSDCLGTIENNEKKS